MNQSIVIKALLGVLFAVFAITNTQAQNTDDGFAALDGQSTTTDSATLQHNNIETDFADTEVTTPDTESSTVYPLIEIGGATILLYFITWLLSKTRFLKTTTHRKIWNVVLLVAFLVSGLLGLMLVVQINYNVMATWYSTFMWLHVDFGIVMAIISIFHACWHTNYYLTLFKKKKS